MQVSVAFSLKDCHKKRSAFMITRRLDCAGDGGISSRLAARREAAIICVCVVMIGAGHCQMTVNLACDLPIKQRDD